MTTKYPGENEKKWKCTKLKSRKLVYCHYNLNKKKCKEKKEKEKNDRNYYNIAQMVDIFF